MAKMPDLLAECVRQAARMRLTAASGNPIYSIFECRDCDERHIEEGDGDHKDRLWLVEQ
jgi:hypothetical protein